MKEILLCIVFCLPLSLKAQEMRSTYFDSGFILRMDQDFNVGFLEENYRKYFHTEIKPGNWSIIIDDWNVYHFKPNKSASSNSILKFLQSFSSIASISRCRKVEMRAYPNDSLYNEQWNLKQIEIEEVWEITTGGATINGDTIVVALLEQGLDVNHIDLEANLWTNDYEIPEDGLDNDGNGYVDDFYGWNFKRDQADFDIDSHGTWVGGVLASKGNNETMITGVGWDTQMMVVQIGDTEPSILKALHYVLKARKAFNESKGTRGAFVVALNASFGLVDPWTGASIPCSQDDIFNQLIDSLGQEGVLVVGAVPNENWDIDFRGDTPSACPSNNMIAVTASDQFDSRAVNAAYGKNSVDLAAPGVNIPSLGVQDRYYPSFGGASAACPHVTGTIGLLYSLPCEEIPSLAISNPGRMSEIIKEVILDGVDGIPSLQNRLRSGGRLNAYNSMLLMEGFCGFNESDSEIGKIYPNPVDTKLAVDLLIEDFNAVELWVTDVCGRQLWNKSLYTNVGHSEIIDVEDWHPGVYFLSLKTNSGISTIRFMKK